MPRLILKSRWDMPQTLGSLLGCLLLLISPSCGSWSGNPPSNQVITESADGSQGTIDLTIQGLGTSTQLADGFVTVIDKQGDVAGRLILSAARLALGSIRIRNDQRDESNRALLQGPFIVDLLTSSVTPSLSRLALPEGQYKDISLRYRQLEKASINANDPLKGNSLLITGTYIDKNSNASSVSIALNVDDEISLMKEAQTKSIDVQSGINQQIIIAFRMDQWFDFSGLEADFSSFSGKDINISSEFKGQYQKIQEALLSNIKGGADFGQDEDRDGKLGRHEDNDEGNDDDDESHADH